MYDKESVYPGDGREYSLEELKCKHISTKPLVTNHHQLETLTRIDESEALSKTVGNGPSISRNNSVLDNYYDDTCQFTTLTSHHKNALNEVIGFFNKSSEEEDRIEREEVTRGRLIIPNDEDFAVFQENDVPENYSPAEYDMFDEEINVDDLHSRRDSDLTSFSLPKSFDALEDNDFTETQKFKDIAIQFKPKSLELPDRPIIFAAQFQRSNNNMYDPFDLFQDGHPLRDAVANTGLEEDENVYFYSSMPPKFEPGSTVNLGMNKFFVHRKVIEDVKGAPEPNYLVQDVTSNTLYVMKKATLWDYYISKRIQHKLPDKDRKYFIEYTSLHIFDTITYITYKYDEKVSMPFTDFIHHQRNTAVSDTRKFGTVIEDVCLYYTMQMLRVVTILHENGFIGARLSASSFYVASNQTSDFSDFKPQTESWNCYGLYMKDYSCVVDMESFPEGACFISKINPSTDVVRYNQKSMAPWIYDIDLYSICDLSHNLLFEKPISLEKDKVGRWKTQETPKLYWEKDLWLTMYDNFLNIGPANQDKALAVEKHMMTRFETLLFGKYGSIVSIKSELSKLLNSQ